MKNSTIFIPNRYAIIEFPEDMLLARKPRSILYKIRRFILRPRCSIGVSYSLLPALIHLTDFPTISSFSPFFFTAFNGANLISRSSPARLLSARI